MMKTSRGAALLALLSLGGLGLAGCGDDATVGPGDFPDARGRWIGRYSVVQCAILSGSDPAYCDDIFYAGRSIALELQLDQSESKIVGTALQGQLSGRVEGDIDDLGTVVLSGQLGVNADATIAIEDWETVLAGDSLIGGWTFLVEDNTGAGFGSARIDADLTLIDPQIPNYLSCAVQATLDQTDAVVGGLGAGDCQLDDHTYYDVYSVDVAVGDEIEIRMASADFEPALLIVDLDGNPVGCSLPVPSEICSRNTPDSLAAVDLSVVFAESWLIVANAFRRGDTGGYDLSTQALVGAGAAIDLTGRVRGAGGGRR